MSWTDEKINTPICTLYITVPIILHWMNTLHLQSSHQNKIATTLFTFISKHMGLKTTPLAGTKSLKVQHLKNNHGIFTGNITIYLTL